MKNNRGQALVEFVLVLPVLVLLLFGMIEFANIIKEKYELETHVDPAIALYKNEDELINKYEKDNDINISFDKSGNLVTIYISKNINLITPGITNFLGNPFEVKTQRTFYIGDESEQ